MYHFQQVIGLPLKKFNKIYRSIDRSVLHTFKHRKKSGIAFSIQAIERNVKIDTDFLINKSNIVWQT
ncbi:MAG: hypothetical protein D3923_02760 [Candidatus Electrothrix sp. AR3]|nr:hypothetical protein [Candidatus Electrothrix sp. AR3]